MKLATKLLLAAFIAPLLIWIMALQFGGLAGDSLRQMVEQSAAGEARIVYDEIDRMLRNRAANWLAYSRSALVNQTLAESNDVFAHLPDREQHLAAKDALWQDAGSQEAKRFIQDILRSRLSRDLVGTIEKLTDISGYAVFGEVFITNAYGANVAQSGRTTDYRQDDEEWWQRAVAEGLYIGGISYDESSGIQSIEICPRIDGEDGELLGVMKAVMNVRGVFEIIDSHAGALENSGTLALLSEDAETLRIAGSNGNDTALSPEISALASGFCASA